MTEDQVWAHAERIASVAEPDDPQARFELAQAIVDLSERRGVALPQAQRQVDK